MAKTFTAPFAQTPKTGQAVVTAAAGGVGTDTVTGAVLMATAGADGCLVTSVGAMPRGTVSASSLLLYLVKAATPTIYRPLDSALLAGYTLAVTTAIPVTPFGSISESTPLRLESGDKLYAASQVALAAGIIFTAKWMDY